MKEGRIVKALSGFYYVKSNDHIYACKGRGVFRKKNINPLVGDFVSFDITNEGEGYITEIKPRNNELIRPPIANVDQALIVSSATMPDFSPLLLDRFLVLVESKHIKPVIFITKVDMMTKQEQEKLNRYEQDYVRIGYPVELVNAQEGSNLTLLQDYFSQKVTVIAGQSGVGKSSILNALDPSLLIKTDEISKSLGRGKHTTRHVELVEVSDGLVADTPGFSNLDFSEIEQEELGNCFPEFYSKKDLCRFRGCLHDKEPGCAVKKSVEMHEITTYRYENYLKFLEEIQTRKPRY